MLSILTLTLVEAFLLQRSVFTDAPFRTVALGAAAVNLALLVIYNWLIWPFFLNPLRHLPRAPVCVPHGPVCQDILTQLGPLQHGPLCLRQPPRPSSS